MAQTMRGMRLGSQSLESEIGVEFYGRVAHSYRCPAGHETSINFAIDAEPPVTWACRGCALEAGLLRDGEVVIEIPAETAGPRTHFEMLLERRSREELEELVQERLAVMRARRARGEADLD
jgi:hypothetical protein